MDLTTVLLPDGWRTRLVKVQNANTAASGGKPQYSGWCLDPHDLCAAKLCAGRAKDFNFVTALLNTQLINADVLHERLLVMPTTHDVPAKRALDWLSASGPASA